MCENHTCATSKKDGTVKHTVTGLCVHPVDVSTVFAKPRPGQQLSMTITRAQAGRRRRTHGSQVSDFSKSRLRLKGHLFVTLLVQPNIHQGVKSKSLNICTYSGASA